MKRVRFQSGFTSGIAVIVDAQLLSLSVVPGTNGTWIDIAGSPIFVPPGTTLDLTAEELGMCCGAEHCDQFPGDTQIAITVGPTAFPDGGGGLPGDPPASWLVVYTGCA